MAKGISCGAAWVLAWQTCHIKLSMVRNEQLVNPSERHYRCEEVTQLSCFACPISGVIEEKVTCKIHTFVTGPPPIRAVALLSWMENSAQFLFRFCKLNYRLYPHTTRMIRANWFNEAWTYYGYEDYWRSHLIKVRKPYLLLFLRFWIENQIQKFYTEYYSTYCTLMFMDWFLRDTEEMDHAKHVYMLFWE